MISVGIEVKFAQVRLVLEVKFGDDPLITIAMIPKLRMMCLNLPYCSKKEVFR